MRIEDPTAQFLTSAKRGYQAHDTHAHVIDARWESLSRNNLAHGSGYRGNTASDEAFDPLAFGRR